MTTKFGSSSFSPTWALVSLPRESMSAVTARSPHYSIARGRSSICHGRATRRSVLNFSDSLMIAAENGPVPALHSDTVAGGTGSSNPACSSGESATNRAVPGEARPAVSSRQRLIKLISVNLDHGRRPLAQVPPHPLRLSPHRLRQSAHHHGYDSPPMGHYRRRGIFRYAVAMTRGAGERRGCGRKRGRNRGGTPDRDDLG